MAIGIGNLLRDERRARGLELDQVEAETKIRTRYLRALEDEDWDVLPGGAYTRSFIRTYAAHLGLDGERLADDYRRQAEDSEERYPRLDPVRPRSSRRDPYGAPGRQGPRPGLVIGAALAIVAAVLIGIGLLPGGDDEGDDGPSGGPREAERPSREERDRPAPPPGARLALRATGEVWVCLIDGSGRRLLNGVILQPGAAEGPFRSSRFTVAFGNGEFEMQINGRQPAVEAGPNPVGYRIGRRGGLAELPEGSRPDCA